MDIIFLFFYYPRPQNYFTLRLFSILIKYFLIIIAFINFCSIIVILITKSFVIKLYLLFFHYKPLKIILTKVLNQRCFLK